MFLYRLHRLAVRLLPWRAACIVLAALGFLLVAHELLVPPRLPPRYLSAAIVLTLWMLMLFAFVQLFRRIPPPVLPKDGLVARLRSHCRLWLHHLLALAVMVAGASLVAMSVKLLSAG